MKKVKIFLISLHVFVGIGALAGGLAAIINPQEPLGITVEALKNSPFSNYLIPGLILFAVIGLGNIISGLLFAFKLSYQGYMSGVFGLALVIWIIVQCIMLNTVVFLHVIYFLIGLVQVVLSGLFLIKSRGILL